MSEAHDPIVSPRPQLRVVPSGCEEYSPPLLTLKDYSELCSELGHPSQGAETFLQILGKKPAETYCSTILQGPKAAQGGRKRTDVRGFDPAELTRANADSRAVYFVVANATGMTGPRGGVCNADCPTIPAFFVEWDDRPIEEQVLLWKELGLPEPTVMVFSGGKSIHCYWALEDPLPAEKWEPIQSRLIAYCKSDQKCKNPSRLMRLPGFRYVNKETGELGGWAEICAESNDYYTPDQIEACLPSEPATAAAPPPVPVDRFFSRPELFNDYQPRELAEIEAAAAFIPERVVGGNTYEPSRRALCGCAAALEEAGHPNPEEAALDLLTHKWPDRSTAQQVLETSTSRNAASFWAIAGEHGYNLSRRDEPTGKPKKKAKGCRRLQPSEVRDRLPSEVGTLKLNTRTGYIETEKLGAISGDDLGQLYLRLCDQQEVWGKELVCDAAGFHARQNRYDPVRNWLESNTAEPLTEDQWQQLDQHLLGFEDPVGGAILRRWLISAIARVMDPGCWWRVAPVLVGKQGTGKTELIRALAGDEWFLSGVGKLDRDACQRLRRAWVVELGELDGITRKADQEHLKAFLTERVDVYRAPYAKGDEAHPRTCVFIGTANAAPLRDSTGSTRFAVIETRNHELPVGWAKENRGAIWAKALEQYRNGAGWNHSPEEQAAINERNAGHTVEDPWEEKIRSELKARRLLYGPLHDALQLNAVYEWLGVAVERQTNQNAERVGRILQSLGWVKAQRRVNGKARRGWWPPGS